MTTRRYHPEAILLHLTWATEPPTSPDVRADVVRLAMSGFASRRDYWRLACLFYSADIDTLKGLFLALQGSPVGDDEDTCPVTYAKALKSVAPAFLDTEFVRLASVAEDVLDWDMSGEWEQYIRHAWLVLSDEVEYEAEQSALEYEERFSRRHDCSPPKGGWWKNSAYTKEEARDVAKHDMRRWREGNE